MMLAKQRWSRCVPVLDGRAGLHDLELGSDPCANAIRDLVEVNHGRITCPTAECHENGILESVLLQGLLRASTLKLTTLQYVVIERGFCHPFRRQHYIYTRSWYYHTYELGDILRDVQLGWRGHFRYRLAAV
jgi:hypothetical protein